MEAAEQRLGLRLPAALREAYALFGRREDLVGSPEGLFPLLRPEQLKTEKLFAADGIELLIYHTGIPGCWECGIRVTDLQLPDPPTVFLNSCADEDCQTTGVAWLDRLSTACVEIALTQWRPLGHELHRRGELRADDLSVLERNFPRLGLPTYPVSRPSCAPGADWFLGDDVLLRLDRYIGTRGDAGSAHDIPSSFRPFACADFEVRGRTAAAVDTVIAQLPKDWFRWPGRR